jgi:gamma-glutamyl hercynylcysteine S-oxide synthase
MPLGLLSKKKKQRKSTAGGKSQPFASHWDPRNYQPARNIKFPDDELSRYFHQERYGLIAADPQQWKNHAKGQQIVRSSFETIDERFALVPEGFVSLPQTVNDEPGCSETNSETEPFLLARCAVTCQQFQHFVDDGAYEQLELWPKEIWPHLIDFVDQTGNPGPRFWRQGRHDHRLAHHPVVGICYYEAAAYARWAGYRLPSEAEWQMAASWRIRSSAQILRRYPWGDALDTERCNIWASGLCGTAPVDAYPSGAAPNGVLQLIGNVWEWTAADFQVTDDEGRPVVGDMLLKSIRGGGFDTYFPNQATSYFRTGLPSLTRSHNVGFRCALNAGSA